MTGEMMWEEYCRTTNTNCNTRHDSVILFDNEEAACIIRDTKVSVVPFNQVSADHAFKEGEDNRSLKKWREVHRKAFTPDYKAVGQDFDEKGDCVLEEFEVVYR